MAAGHGYGMAHMQQSTAANAWSNDDLKAALHACAAEGATFVTKTVYERWRTEQPVPRLLPSSSRIANRFGTWLAALQAAGMEPGPRSIAQSARAPTRRTSARRDREHWTSDGCAWFASCFTCELPKCRFEYDDPREARLEAEDCAGFLLRN